MDQPGSSNDIFEMDSFDVGQNQQYQGKAIRTRKRQSGPTYTRLKGNMSPPDSPSQSFLVNGVDPCASARRSRITHHVDINDL